MILRRYEHSSASFYELGIVKQYKPLIFVCCKGLHIGVASHSDSYRNPMGLRPIIEVREDPQVLKRLGPRTIIEATTPQGQKKYLK